MADIRAFYEELGLYYIHKQRDEVSPGFSDTTRRVFDALKCFLPIGDDAIDLSTLFDIVNYTSCKDLINSDELLARAVRQMDAAVEEISAVRDIAAKYLPADSWETAGESEYMYNGKGEKVCASNSGDGDDPFRQSVMRKFTRQE